ncbi:MAG: hypothetical protein ACI4Q4_08025, partial [Oscillospiraceae bacterium]
TVSVERHGVSGFPEGLEFRMLHRGEHGDYMDSLMCGAYGEMLEQENAALYEKIRRAERWVLVSGEIQQDDTLEYFKSCIGIVQAICENGAEGVLDLQTITLYSPQDWHDKVFAADFEPVKATIIMASRTDNGLWLHTRGMRKFGRPDIGIEGIPENDLQTAAEIAEQMIRYSAMGAVFTQGAVFCISGGRSYSVNPEFVPDFDNDDFNNAYYRIKWAECSLRPDED